MRDAKKETKVAEYDKKRELKIIGAGQW